MSFESYYLSNLFNETNENNNAIEECSAIRNSLLRLHNEGVKSLCNTSTSMILDQRLNDYYELFNNDTKDGYMNQMSSLINNSIKMKTQTRHCANWQSKLRSSNLNPKNIVLKSLERIAHCGASSGESCNALDVDKESLKELLRKKSYSPQLIQNKTILQVDNKKNHSNNIFKPKVSTTRPDEKVTQYVNSINNQVRQCSDFKPNNTISASNASEGVGFQNPLNEHTSNNRIPQNISVPQKPVETNNIVKRDSFWSARTELQIQNKKKYGNNKQNYPSVPEPGVLVKKCLGTTRSSVQNKFIPPLAGNSGSAQTAEPANEIEDERLKNIDPKMIEFIRSEIIDSSSPIGWDDIAGLEFAKSVIQEAVVWPLLRPDIFTGLRRPPKGILLFGPPGTGKTLIGKCIASQCCATFFSISASSLTSKWIGDGEKMVRALFAVARCHQPAVVFIDEIDSLLTQRSDTEHEATRRIKTEFLVQLDGAATGDEDRFLVIGATNRPQELDEAARRRLVKRLYIPLPDVNARQQIICRLMTTEKNSLNEQDIENIAQLTNGYSGADMRSLCSEAALGPIRAVPLSQITNIQCDEVRSVNSEDFEKALTRVRPSVSSNDLEHYVQWDKTYGSGNSH